MSEVKSAKELAHDFIEFNSYESIEYGYPILNNGADGDLEITIKSDRRAIIEKCKEEVEDLKSRLPSGFMSHDDEIYYDALSDCIGALDSVLSEIEKGE